jgi:hypothetical protein
LMNSPSSAAAPVTVPAWYLPSDASPLAWIITQRNVKSKEHFKGRTASHAKVVGEVPKNPEELANSPHVVAVT